MHMQGEDAMMGVLDDFRIDQADASTCGCSGHYILCLSTPMRPNCAFLSMEYVTRRKDVGLISQFLLIGFGLVT